MTLLDQFERPISSADIARLRQPEVLPTLAGIRPAFSWHPADGLTPARMASIHRMAAYGESLQYLQLAEDIEERDLHYAAVLSTRKRSVAQLPITVVAAGEDAAQVEHNDFIKRWVDTGVLEGALFDILDGVGKGFSVHETLWHTGPDGYWPEAMVYRPQRWFEVDRTDGDTIMLREATTRLPLMPHKFLVHRHPSKSGLVMRSGLARIASWAWMWKAFTLRDWAGFVQNYGQPMRVGRYGPESSKEDRAVLWQAVANIAGDCAAIIPKGMEIEFVEVGDLKAGSELYEKRADWMDRQISKLVLGQTTTTDAISGGHAVSQEHRLVQEDIERSDARMVSNSVTRQLVQTIIALNFGPQKAYPRLLIGRPDEVPIKEVVEGVSKLVAHGFRVKQSEIRDRLGLTEPGEDDEVFGEPKGALADAELPPAPPPPRKGRKPPARVLNAAQARMAALATPEAVELLTERVAQDAAGAMAGLTDAIRAEFDAATDMADLAERIARLQLDPKALTEAMGRAMAIAHLAGQAEVLDELAPAKK